MEIMGIVIATALVYNLTEYFEYRSVALALKETIRQGEISVSSQSKKIQRLVYFLNGLLGSLVIILLGLGIYFSLGLGILAICLISILEGFLFLGSLYLRDYVVAKVGKSYEQKIFKELNTYLSQQKDKTTEDKHYRDMF